jgi:hypothetical protein
MAIHQSELFGSVKRLLENRGALRRPSATQESFTVCFEADAARSRVVHDDLVEKDDSRLLRRAIPALKQQSRVGYLFRDDE